jgi:hypothetical protein
MDQEEKRKISYVKKMQDFPFCESDRVYHAKREYNRIVDEELEIEIDLAYNDVLGEENLQDKRNISSDYELGEW